MECELKRMNAWRQACTATQRALSSHTKEPRRRVCTCNVRQPAGKQRRQNLQHAARIPADARPPHIAVARCAPKNTHLSPQVRSESEPRRDPAADTREAPLRQVDGVGDAHDYQAGVSPAGPLEQVVQHRLLPRGLFVARRAPPNIVRGSRSWGQGLGLRGEGGLESALSRLRVGVRGGRCTPGFPGRREGCVGGWGGLMGAGSTSVGLLLSAIVQHFVGFDHALRARHLGFRVRI